MTESQPDIVAFLTRSLDEDEQLARHAAHIAHEGGTRWVVGRARHVEGYEFVSIHTAPPSVIEVAGSGFDDSGGIHGLVYAEHIVRHDPARVLADIAAKRAILADVIPGVRSLESDLAAEQGAPRDEDPAVTYEDSNLLLRLLAAPYADRPGYNPAWTIEV